MSRSLKHNPVRKWACNRKLRNRMLRAKLSLSMDMLIPDGNVYRKMLDCEAETFGWESWDETLKLERMWNPDFKDEDERELYIKWYKEVMGK